MTSRPTLAWRVAMGRHLPTDESLECARPVPPRPDMADVGDLPRFADLRDGGNLNPPPTIWGWVFLLALLTMAVLGIVGLWALILWDPVAHAAGTVHAAGEERF